MPAPLTRQQISDAVGPLGWRLILGVVVTHVRVTSVAAAAEAATCAVSVRPQRNRLHLDVDVPPEQAASRIDAALAAGGTLLADDAAPAFWVLADPEGNEACVCTWQGRD